MNGPWWENFGLSGIAVILMMSRIFLCWPVIGWPEAIGLFLCLVVHYGKDYLLASKDINHEAVMAEISQLQSDLTNLESKMSGINLNLGIKSSISEES